MSYSFLQEALNELNSAYGQFSGQEDGPDAKNFDSYATALYIAVENILKQEKESDVLVELKAFLQDNEARVRNTMCAYSKTSLYDTTKFLIKIAKFLANPADYGCPDKQPVCTSAISALYPLVNKSSFLLMTENDFVDLQKEKTVEEVIRQYTLTTDGKYLMPVKEIMHAYKNATVDLIAPNSQIRHIPFEKEETAEVFYSDEDLAQVQNHSSLTATLTRFIKERNFLYKKDNSLLGALTRIRDQFELDGVEGLGQEYFSNQGEIPLNKFFQFWNMLPQSEKDKANSIKEFALLVDAFKKSNKIHSHTIEFNGNPIAKIDEKGLVSLLNQADFSYIKEGDAFIIRNKLKQPLVRTSIKDRSLIWKINEQIVLKAHTYVGQEFTCVNSWKTIIDDIIRVEKNINILASVSLNDKSSEDQIKKLNKEIDRLLDSIGQESYTGEICSRAVNLNFLEFCGLSFQPRNVKELLETIRDLSTKDLAAFYPKYEEQIRNAFKQPKEDILLCAKNLSLENFTTVAEHLNEKILTIPFIISFLNFKVFKTAHREIILLNTYRFSGNNNFDLILRSINLSELSSNEKAKLLSFMIKKAVEFNTDLFKSNDEFKRILRHMSNSDSYFPTEQIKSFLERIVNEGIENQAFCLNNEDLRETIETMTRCNLLDNYQVLAFIKSCIKNRFKECIQSEISETLKQIDESYFEEDEKQEAIAFLWNERVNYEGGLCKNNNQFIEIIERLSLSNVKTDMLYLAYLMKLVLKDYFGFCTNNPEFIRTIMYINQANISDADKSDCLNLLINGIAQHFNPCWESYGEFLGTIEIISDSFLEEDKINLAKSNLLTKAIEINQFFCRDFTDVLKTVNRITSSSYSEQKKVKWLILFLSNEKNPLKFCQNFTDFQEIMDEIRRSKLSEKSKLEVLEKTVPYLVKGKYFEDKFSEFLEWISDLGCKPSKIRFKQELVGILSISLQTDAMKKILAKKMEECSSKNSYSEIGFFSSEKSIGNSKVNSCGESLSSPKNY